jgi:hypothetical protein
MFMPMSSPLHQLLYKTLSVAELGANGRRGRNIVLGLMFIAGVTRKCNLNCID